MDKQYTNNNNSSPAFIVNNNNNSNGNNNIKTSQEYISAISCSPDLTSINHSVTKGFILPQQSNLITSPPILAQSANNHHHTRAKAEDDKPLSTLSSSLSELIKRHSPPSATSSTSSTAQSNPIDAATPSSSSSSASSSFTPTTIDKSDVKIALSSHIESREKEIERLTRVAEKDKSDCIAYLNSIKDHKEQLSGYIKDFYDDPIEQQQQQNDHSDTSSTSSNNSSGSDRKQKIIEKHTALNAIEGTIFQTPYSVHSPITTSFISQSPSLSNTISLGGGVTPTPPAIQSMSFWDSPHQNPQPSSSSSSQQQQHESEKESVSGLVSSFHNKDEELERVKNRTSTQSLKANFLREKFEELSQLVQLEKENWSTLVDAKKKEVEQKEREICRLLMLAETQKKQSMDLTDQITRLKKSLSSISQLRGSTCGVDMKKLNEKFSVDSPSSSFGSLGHKSPMKLSPTQSPKTPCGTSKCNSSHDQQTKCFTEEKKELMSLTRMLEKKEEEIRRIKDIIEYEMMRTNYLSNKVGELKLMLEEESRQVESMQLKSLKEMREKEDAILKVALRAQKERIKANQIKDEIKKLLKELNYDDPSNKSKKNALDLDSVFIEMGDLNEFQNLSLSPYCDENLQLKQPKFNLQQQQQNQNNNNHQHNNNSNNIGMQQQRLSNSNLYNIMNNDNTNNVNILNNNNHQHNNNQHHHHHHHHQQQQPRNGHHVGSAGSAGSSNICIPTATHPNRRGSINQDISTGGGSLSPTFHYLSSYYTNNQHHSRSPKSTSAISMSPSVTSASPHFLIGSPTEIINFKLQEIDKMSKATCQKDCELAKVKKIAEAERSRFAILKDKYKELRMEYSERESIHT